MIDTLRPPDVATGTKLAAFGDKKAVGELAGNMSVRWVDNQLALGMPHLKISARRVRFDLPEVSAWLKGRYGQQRVGKMKKAGAQ